MVLPSDFDAAIADNKETCSQSGVEPSGGEDVSEASSGKNHVEDGTAEAAVDSNALRIRSDAELSLKGDAQEDLTSATEHSYDSLLDRLSVTFPSAFRQVSESAVDEHFPFVTINPTYLETRKDEELFLDLDSLSLSAFDREFLAGDATSYRSGWQQGLRGHNIRDSSIPLSAVMMARLEASVVEAFVGVEEKRVAELQFSGQNDEIFASIGIDHDFSCQETENRTEDQRPVMSQRRLSLRTLLTDLSLRARTLNDSTSDHAVVMGFMSPFLDAIGIGRLESPKLGELLFTPLKWLAPKEHIVIDFSVLDNGIQCAFRNREEHISVATYAVPSDSATKESQSVSATLGTTAVEQTQKPKKKKRKLKRRHKKKPTNTDKLSSPIKETHLALDVAKESDDTSIASEPLPSVQPEGHGEELLSTTKDAETNEDVIETKGVEPAATGDSVSVRSADSVLADFHAAENSCTTSAMADNTISQNECLLAVAPPASSQVTLSAKSIEPGKRSALTDVEEAHVEDDDGAAWETVEVKLRGRKKGSDRASYPVSRHGSFNDSFGSNGKKAKGARTTGSRRKATTRKVAKDILASLLDKVDEEVRRKKPIATRPAVNPWKVGSPATTKVAARQAEGSDKITEDLPTPPEKTMRDVVMEGMGGASPKRPTPQSRFFPESKRSPKKDQLNRSKTSPTHRSRVVVGIPADQNTAPTYQETVSALSTPSNAAVDSREGRTSTEERVSKPDSNSDGTNEAPQNQERTVSLHPKDAVSRDPPLTLLSPDSANSATSSVASSLEVPRGAHRHHHSNCSDDVNDVGYHLLDVCDRLSSDMSLFMSRRQLALSSRRRERGALLSALQETINGIWSSRGHVEMYGSCAIQLDLPSSDLDVVVVGLDRNDQAAHAQSKSSTDGSKSPDERATVEKTQPVARSTPLAPYHPLPMKHNGERILRLAAELERLPWAVQVKAIPTASVPVVKILADPSRLNGATNGGEWMAHHQHLAAQAAAAEGRSSPLLLEEEDGAVDARQHFHHQSGLLPWRGADVMNGLLKLDITFEGPEHGGIGSTEFSALTVAEACKESGLHPDATPFVQVVMVLKEMLVQRKLNEPYSGGLSSYALLLLVVALLHERAAIKEEIERVEQQRRAMAAGDTDGTFSGSGESSEQATNAAKSAAVSVSIPERTPKEPSGDTKAPEKKPFSSQGTNTSSTSNSPTATTKSNQLKRMSSWASVAKKLSSSPPSGHGSKEIAHKPAGEPSSRKTSTASKKPSFADAVAKSTGAGVSSEKKMVSQKKNANGGPTENGSLMSGNDHSTKTEPIPQKTLATQETKKTLCSAAAPFSVGQSATSVNSHLIPEPSFFAQGYNDIVEVLCSGETTAGKLLMHFLLFYGEHFDAQSTAIDISGKHDRGYTNQLSPFPYMSPYILRRSHGNIDPVTGMLTVDPIIIYDPLEGAENNNVARRCFAWNSVRWIFAQSYATLSSAVERSATPPANAGGRISQDKNRDPPAKNTTGSCTSASDIGDLMDPSSPLLRCLLSF